MADFEEILIWARHMDHGIHQLECSVDRNFMQDSEVHQREVQEKFQDIIDDARTIKASAQRDVERLKAMSDELKELINLTESEEVKKMDSDLKEMLDALFPNNSNIEEESVAAIEVEDVNEVESLVEVVTLSPPMNQQSSLEESYTEVEITPGLVSKILKSRLAAGDLIPSSAPHRYVPCSLYPLRKKTLVFSPGDVPPGDVPRIPETNSPPVGLQDRSNVGSELTNSPEVLKRPQKPALRSRVF